MSVIVHKNPAGAEERSRQSDERGTATIIAVLIMALLAAFVAVALSRTTSEALIMGNDAAEARSFYAAQAGLETMTHNFNKIFDLRLNPIQSDLDGIVSDAKKPQNFTGFSFTSTIAPNDVDDIDTETVPIAGGPFEGLLSQQDRWTLSSTATGPTGVQKTLTRYFLNNRIPIFQFGSFYNDDLELSPGAKFDFGGRVHTNGNLYVTAGGRVNFNSRVTSAGEVVVDVRRNGTANIQSPNADQKSAGFGYDIWIKSATDANNDGIKDYVQLGYNQGSVINGPDINSSDTDVPDGTRNSLWKFDPKGDGVHDLRFNQGGIDKFDGNLVARTKRLELPLRLSDQSLDNIEIIKRGRSTDSGNPILRNSRFYNHPGIRITLSDTQSRLPGGTGGIRLDAKYDDNGNLDPTNGKLGYQPAPLGSYRATRFNAYRLYRGKSYNVDGLTNPDRQSWIKVEIVTRNESTLEPVATDITAAFLSLGLTERAPGSTPNPNSVTSSEFRMGGTGSTYDNAATGTDSRAILKLQRWAVPGPPIKNNPDDFGRPEPSWITSGPPQLRRTERVEHNWGGNSPDSSRVPADKFYVRWTGQVKTPSGSNDTGNYTFTAEGDDGVRLYIHNGTNWVLLTQNSWKDQGPTKYSGTISLQKNTKYNIMMEYYENGGGAVARLYWKGPNSSSTISSSSDTIIADTYLYPSASATSSGGLTAEYYNKLPFTFVNVVGNSEEPFGYSCVTVDNYTITELVNNAGTVTANNLERAEHSVPATINGNATRIVPFPIEMFDAREGLQNEYHEVATPYDNTDTVPLNGVMSLVDIDIANFRRYVNGDFDSDLPSAARSSSVPDNSGDGWIIYVSDRRGDCDDDGEFDMEDVYTSSDDQITPAPSLQPGEDANRNGELDTDEDFKWEGARYRGANAAAPDQLLNLDKSMQDEANNRPAHYATVNSDIAALFDHRHFRRGVRLINGETLPGSTTRGLTVASENGVYVLGNYNATGVDSHNDPTPASGYNPLDGDGQVPAAIIADAVTILSRRNPLEDADHRSGWSDGASFGFPTATRLFSNNNYRWWGRESRETTVRAAIMSGDSISSLKNTPHQGGEGSERGNGALNNFKHMLERWGGDYSTLR